MNSKKWCGNPHIRCNLITLFSSLVPRKEAQRDENFNFVFKNSQIIKKFLIPAIIRVFIDSERTGKDKNFKLRLSQSVL